MWVDIIPKTTESRVLPPVININPRKPVKYVFRTVVWSVADVTLPDNQKTSDFYVTRYCIIMTCYNYIGIVIVVKNNAGY